MNNILIEAKAIANVKAINNAVQELEASQNDKYFYRNFMEIISIVEDTEKLLDKWEMHSKSLMCMDCRNRLEECERKILAMSAKAYNDEFNTNF